MSVEQAAFVRTLLDPEVPVPAGLINPDGAPATKRFDVYRNNVVVSLTAALETAFPVVAKLLGTANFRVLARAFLRKHPPEMALMMHYGVAMPSFLATFEPVQSLPYLPDVARLELALRESYHAADREALIPSTFQSIAPDRLMAGRLILAPAVRLIRSRWPVHGIWLRNTEGGPKPGLSGENVLIARPEFDPIMTTLPPGGGVFLEAVMGGDRFGQALDKALTAKADFDLTAVLGILLSGAAIVDLIED